MILCERQFAQATSSMLQKSRVLENTWTWEQEFLVDCTWVVLYFALAIFPNTLFIISWLWLQESIWTALRLLILIGWLRWGQCFSALRADWTKLKPRWIKKDKVWFLSKLRRQRRRKKRFSKKDWKRKKKKDRWEWANLTLLLKQAKTPNFQLQERNGPTIAFLIEITNVLRLFDKALKAQLIHNNHYNNFT